MADILEIELRPGCVGYYEPLSNTYLAFDRKSKVIPAEADVSGLAKAYHEQGMGCPFIIKRGALPVPGVPNEEAAQDVAEEVPVPEQPSPAVAEVMERLAIETSAPKPRPRKKS